MSFRKNGFFIFSTLPALILVSALSGGEAWAAAKKEKKKTTAQSKQEAVTTSLDSEERIKAVRRLAALTDSRVVRDEGVVEALLKVVEKEEDDLRVRVEGVEALAKLQVNVTSSDNYAKYRYLPVFIKILKDKKEYYPLRKAVAEAFGTTLNRKGLKDEQAFSAMLKIAEDKLESVPVRIQVVQALGRFGSPKAFSALSHLLTARDEDLQTAAAKALSDLLDKLAANPEELSLATVNRLMAFAKDPKRPAELRKSIITALARLYRQGFADARRAVSVILDLLAKENNEEVLMAAVRAAGTTGEVRVIPALEKVYGDFRELPKTYKGNPAKGRALQAQVRRSVMKALKDILRAGTGHRTGAAAGRQVLALLCRALNDEKETQEVKESAVFSMYYLYHKTFKDTHKKAILTLRGLLDAKGNEGLRAGIAETLSAITGRDYGENVNRWREWIDKTYPQ